MLESSTKTWGNCMLPGIGKSIARPSRLSAIAFVVVLTLAHAAPGQMIQTHPSDVLSYGMFNAFAWSPDGTKLALAHSGMVSLMDANNLQRLDTFYTTHCGSGGSCSILQT